MRKAIVVLCVLAATTVAYAGAGDWWILPIDRTDGNVSTLSGAGYNGTDAVRGVGMDGVRRVWWNTNNVYQSSGGSYPAAAELFTIEAFGPSSGGYDWQPIEVQFNGYAGDAFPMEPGIPWAGQFGTNHQYVGSDGAAGIWKQAGPGPQDPFPGQVYAKGGSTFYAKWDFPWPIDRSWSMIRVTQITPEPASALLLLLGMPLLRRKSR